MQNVTIHNPATIIIKNLTINVHKNAGWLCVRHTRHDQFPVIADENFLQVNPSSKGYFVTSPDRRLNTFDIDLSEHSDHTDQSTAESIYSETRLNRTLGAMSIDENQDVVDYKGYQEPDKRKSHTLPIQGCSHEKSLTESRTVDILRDYSTYERTGRMHMENRLLGRMNSLEHEGRVRNTSESSTSGVSSCDSFLGKYVIP